MFQCFKSLFQDVSLIGSTLVRFLGYFSFSGVVLWDKNDITSKIMAVPSRGIPRLTGSVRFSSCKTEERVILVSLDPRNSKFIEFLLHCPTQNEQPGSF